MGRRTKLLDPKRRKIILESISKGNYIQTACLAGDIDPTTYCNWQRWAEEYERDPTNGNERKLIYFQFFQDLKNAEAKAESEIVSRIDEAGKHPQYWASNAFRLERKSPGRWGRRDVLEIGPSKVLLALREEGRKLIESDTKLIE